MPLQQTGATVARSLSRLPLNGSIVGAAQDHERCWPLSARGCVSCWVRRRAKRLGRPSMMPFQGHSLALLMVITTIVGAPLACVRHKQRFAVSAMVHRPGETGPARPLRLADVRPGDELRFRVSSPRRGFLAVVGIGGRTGMETAVYYPAAPYAAPIEAGDDIDLPSTIADERVGQELVYGFICNKPVRLDEIRGQLDQPRSASTYMVPVGGLDVPCDIDTFGFLKCEPDECSRERE